MCLAWLLTIDIVKMENKYSLATFVNGRSSRCKNRPICTRFRCKILINPLRWELTHVRLSTRHMLIHILEVLNQHNSPKTIANPVVPVRVIQSHTQYQWTTRAILYYQSSIHVRYRRVPTNFHYKPWAHESHIKQRFRIYYIYMLSWSWIMTETY